MFREYRVYAIHMCVVVFLGKRWTKSQCSDKVQKKVVVKLEEDLNSKIRGVELIL